MKKIKALTVPAIMAVFMYSPVQAEDGHAHAHDSAQSAPSQVNAAAAETSTLTDGEIRKIDKEKGALTIRHGEIRNLNMPPMTMVFYVKDNAMLSGLQAGDKIKFAVIEEDRKMVITELVPQK